MLAQFQSETDAEDKHISVSLSEFCEVVIFWSLELGRVLQFNSSAWYNADISVYLDYAPKLPR